MKRRVLIFDQQRRDQRGAAIVLVAVSLSCLIAITALVVDGFLLMSSKSQSQNIAEFAALAAVREYVRSGGANPSASANALAAANTVLASNIALGFKAGTPPVLALASQTAASHDGILDIKQDSAGRLSVTVTVDQAQGRGITPVFAKMIGIHELRYSVQATATYDPGIANFPYRLQRWG